MGVNGSVQKITIDEKLQFLQNKIQRLCKYHAGQQVIIFCSLPNCQKSPFLCQQCLNLNIHSHEQGLYKHNQFLKSIIKLIELKKVDDNKSMFASQKTQIKQKDYANIIKQLMKLMQCVDMILNETTNKLTQYKRKLQLVINRTMQKANRKSHNKSDSYYRFYSNPNILVNKINSENDDEFILSLKSKLDITASKKMFTDEEELQNYKAEFDGIKSGLRELLNVNNVAYFGKKTNGMPIASIIDPKASFKKSIVMPDYPVKVFPGAYSIFGSTKKQLIKIEPFEREKQKIHNQGVNKLSANNLEDGEFLSITSPHNALFWDGKQMQKINLLTKISGINVLKSRKSVYGLLGEEEGVFNVIDLKQNKSVFHYRCNDRPILHIEICQPNSTIYCGCQIGNIFMFKYQLKFDEFQFDYIGQLPSTLLPVGQLQLMKIKNYDMYLLGPYRNLVLYDLMLNTQIVRTQNNRKAPQFTDATIFTISNSANKTQEILITLNENQAVLYSWAIDRGRRIVKVDPIILPNRDNKLEEIPILSITSYKHEIWAIKENLKQLHAFSIEL